MNQAYGRKQIGSRLSACRQNKNMTQEELAGRLGVTPQALTQGVPIAYLPKAIETIDRTMRENPKSTAAELAEQIKGETLREDNYSNVMAKKNRIFSK